MNSLDLVIQEIAERTASRIVLENLAHLEKKIDDLPNIITDRLRTKYTSDDILNTVQVAECLGVTPQTVANWRNKGLNIPYHLQNGKARSLQKEHAKR
ncbi:MAG: hypothetical protein LBP51_07275 [Deferribacteraceae bacterium]|jgi:DNA-binding transcriptional MerR regulator|nr:hypothetical protein [Deferribacteraceae bacterium]